MLNTVYRLTQPRKIEIAFTEIDLFKPEVVVKPTYLSICHADQRYYQGTRDPKILAQKLPMALIHEGIGEVVYSPVAEFKPGDKVVMIPNTPVEHDDIIAENYLRSSKFRASGFDGFMQEYVQIAPDRLVDHALRGARSAVADGEICLADVAVRLELAAELEVRVLRLGEDNDAGSAAVESVDDARTLLRPDCRGGRAMRDKLVGQRAALVPWRRMHNLPGGLVRHEYRLVLVDDVHRIRKSSKPRGLAFRW